MRKNIIRAYIPFQEKKREEIKLQGLSHSLKKTGERAKKGVKNNCVRLATEAAVNLPTGAYSSLSKFLFTSCPEGVRYFWLTLPFLFLFLWKASKMSLPFSCRAFFHCFSFFSPIGTQNKWSDPSVSFQCLLFSFLHSQQLKVCLTSHPSLA